jgi:hypothetical protein
MEMHRIKEISIFEPGNLDFNIPSTWQSMRELTLDNGRKILMKGRGFASGRRSDGSAMFVPLKGDWIYFEGSEPHVFQFKQVVQVLGDSVQLSNGESCSASGMYRGSCIPVKGDYIVLRTDGVAAVRQHYFEEENASLIAAVKEAQAEEKQRKVAS